MLNILTFNTAIQDIKMLGYSVYQPVKFTQERLVELANQLLTLAPDIICLQELFHLDLQQQLYARLKSDYPYASGFAKSGFRLRLGNELLIFSKLPLRAGELFRFSNATMEERLFTSKGFYKALVESSMGEIQLVNIHMSAGGLHNHPENPQMENIRAGQIQQLIRNISNDFPTLLIGDLNAGPETSQHNYQAILNAGFTDAFAMITGSGVTWDPDNPLVASNNENHLPAQRIDHIFLNQAALQLMAPVSGDIVLNDLSVVLPDDEKIPLSDHYGIQCSLQKTIS